MKKLIVIVLTSCLLISLSNCGMMKDAIYLDSNVRKLEQGMSKKEVTNLLGKNFQVIEGRSTYKGFSEVIAYPNGEEGAYNLIFLDGKLDAWVYEKNRPHHHSHPH